MSEQNQSAEVPPQQPPSFGQAPTGADAVGEAQPPAETPAKKKSGIGRFLIWIVVLVLAGGAYWFFIGSKDATNAKVGDCLGGTSAAELDADNLKIVDCTAGDANFKVVQKIDGKTQAQADADGGSICTDATTEFYFWSGEEGKAGTVLCLATNKK